MTQPPASPQPQRDNILWQNFNALVNSLNISAKERASLFYWENEYRSRPHTPAPTNTELIRCSKTDCVDYKTELCQPWKCSHAMKQHDAAIARAATLAALDELEQHAIKAGFVRYDNKGRICNYTYINPKRLLQKIESLRQSTTAAQEDRR